MKTPSYRINLVSDDNDTLLVTSDDFPELTTFGEDRESALKNALGAIEEAVAARIAAGREVPTPSARTVRSTKKAGIVSLPTLSALKVLLYKSLRSEGVTRAELARRLGWHREQVDRLFRLDHASRLDQLEEAYRAINQNIEISVTPRPSARAQA